MFAVVDTWACPSRLDMLTRSTPLKYSIEAIVLIPNVNSDVTLGRYVAVAGQIQGDPRFPEAAWPYLDFAKIGAEYYAEHGGAYTYAGYLLRKQDDELVREKKSKIQLGLSSFPSASEYLPSGNEGRIGASKKSTGNRLFCRGIRNQGVVFRSLYGRAHSHYRGLRGRCKRIGLGH